MLTVRSRLVLAARRISWTQVRGKALQNWKRPSIDEMGVPAEPWGRVHDRNQKKFSTQVKSWFTLIKIVIIFVAVSRLVPVRGDCDDGDQHDQDEQHTSPPS